MTSMYRGIFALGCVFGALGVIAGAAGAHHFQPVLSEVAYASYATATSYLLWHAVALVGLAAWHRSAAPIGWLGEFCVLVMIAGTVLFCGGLFGWTIAEWSWARRCAPWGGSALVLAWLGLAVSAWRTRSVVNG